MYWKRLSIVVLATGIMAGCGNNNSGKFIASGVMEGTTVKVSAQTGGYILNMQVEEGDDIEANRVIAVVDTEKLVFQSEQIQAALEELNVQRRININLLEKAKTEFNHINTKYQRYKGLYQNNSASRQALDDLKTAYDAGEIELQNARQNLKLVEARQKSLEAQGKLLQRQIKDATIIAPLSGTITTKYYEYGETIPTNAAIVEMINLNKMWIKVYVSEITLPKIRVGQAAEIRIDGTDESLTGTVAWISPRAEFTPKNILTEEGRTALVYAVKVNVDNPNKVLKHGMPVEVAVNYD